MGNSESKNIEEQAFSSSHPYFKDAKVIVNKTQPITRSIQSSYKIQDAQYDQWHKLLDSGPTKLTSEYILLPEKTNYKHDQGLCGNTGTLTVTSPLSQNLYPYYPHTLEKLIRERQDSQTLFKESELWYVLFALAAAKRDLKGRSAKFGDIKPENIFISDDGRVKVASQYSWPGELPSFERATDMERYNYNGLLAPEDFSELQRGSLENDHNTQSEIFAIGATVISAGILSGFEGVYNYKNKTFNTQAFREVRRKWANSERYSPIFKSIVLNLVDSNPGERLTEDELWQFISPYSSSILDKSQFVIETAPKKV